MQKINCWRINLSCQENAIPEEISLEIFMHTPSCTAFHMGAQVSKNKYLKKLGVLNKEHLWP